MKTKLQAAMIVASLVFAAALTLSYKPYVPQPRGGFCEPSTVSHTVPTETVCDDYCWMLVEVDRLRDQARRMDRTLDELIEAVKRRQEKEE